MAKVSPIIRSFNSGEFSILVEGRTDLDRYPSSLRSMKNYVCAPQGPAIPRSGTQYINRAYKNDEVSALIPFVPTETEFYMLEFANQRVRFFTEDGLLTYAPVAATTTQASPHKFDSATLAANIGDEVAFSDYPEEYNLNGVVAKITAKVGTVYTVDVVHPALPLLATGKVARVYHIASPYTSAVVNTIIDTPSIDVVYLTCATIAPHKLLRNDTYDWAFVKVDFIDGPYLPTNETNTTLTPTTTGKATADMTAANAPAGHVVSGSTEQVGNEAWKAFDNVESATSWRTTANQVGTITYQHPAGFIADGYTVYITHLNDDANYAPKDYAPSTWTFEGSNDGVNYTVLDRRSAFVAYANNKSLFFEIPNATSYTYYRLVVNEVFRSGAVKVSIKSLVIRSTASRTITVNASSAANINNGQGFLAADVGRLIRMRGDDNTWRELLITARNSATQVVCTLRGEPFSSLLPCKSWRLGYWSDTTGYPNTATFYQDRLWFGGSTKFPDLVVGSYVGKYEVMSPTEYDGVVGDSNAIAIRLNARKLSRVKWLVGGKDGLLVGTGSQEYVLRSNGSDKTLSPNNGIKADEASARGSSDAQVAAVDTQVLYVTRSGRTVREFGYSYEVDNYKSPSMSSLASHLGVKPFKKLVYATEPYGIVWCLRDNGTIVGLTYNRDENVVGWHTHNFPDTIVDDVELDGYIESVAVLPSADQLQDMLWIIIRRTVDGQTVRYVEKLTKFWDFGMTIDDAHFVDSALRYQGDATSVVYGMSHLEGRSDLYGIADGVIIGPLTVEDGAVTLPQEAENVIIGIGFEGYGEVSRLENGSQDGTAQGKTKRFNSIAARFWDSYGGEFGVYNEDSRTWEFTPVAYPVADASLVETIQLYSGDVSDIVPVAGYERSGSIAFRRPKGEPVPFIPIAIFPQMDTQDRR
jgi:hypothetical protein